MRISIVANELDFGGSMDKMFETLQGYGYSAIDYIGHGLGRFDAAEEKDYCKRLTESAERHGFIIGQTHAPFLIGREKERHLTNTEEEFLGDWLRTITEKAIERTARLNCKYLVVHPYFPQGLELFINGNTYDYGKFIDHNKEVNLKFFSQFIPLLKATGVQICIENLFAYDVLLQRHVPAVGSDPEEMHYYIDRLGDENFACCYDSGHLNHFGADEGEYIRKIGKRLKVVHFNDSFGKAFHGMDWHLMPGQGDVDWEKVASALKEIGYEGTANFEVGARKGKFFHPQLRYMAEVGHAIFNEEKQ